MTKLTKFIQGGLLTLVAIMPFHAFLSVWLGHIFGHQALFQAWKEVLLIALCLAAALLIWREPTVRSRLRQPWVFAGAGLIIVGLIVSAVTHPGYQSTLFGFKTDFEFIVAAGLATLVSSSKLVHNITTTILIGAALVTGFDTLQIFILPINFLAQFGYGPATIVPYQHIAAGTSALRFPSTLGGPNQLGTYLILPLCIAVSSFILRRRWWLLLLIATSVISLTFTFSRSAWIGALVAVSLTIMATLPSSKRRSALILSGIIILVSVIALPFALSKGGPLQYFLLHSSLATHNQSNLSDSQHVSSLRAGLTADLHNPFGHGLGTAGPTVFHVGTGTIIENYYLQLGYEMGLLAIVLFVTMLILLINALLRPSAPSMLAVPCAAAIVGISVVAFVLPAWVDSSTALITLIAAGAAGGLTREHSHV